ncbi:MAG: ATP-binding cassette domain-containing protein [Sulfurimonadaceae bacterium]|jgi:phospholipid/cholesterol/gamma-HCH transport system ATP-binding protein|nr:ATP-binding cassette domain-containing protein [Sulfurimonadaceae bacterium]
MEAIIKVMDTKTIFGTKVVHDGLNLTIPKGSIYGILGPSGCGKTTLLRQMLLLQGLSGGEIEVLSQNISTISHKQSIKLISQWGVMFQYGALFSSLNLRENVALPLIEYTKLDKKLIDDIVEYKINIVGLKPSDALLYPSQMSGGMRKKASLARALALDPKLLFLDEPTSGLDPISAREFDKLILSLRDMLGLSVVMVTHDLQSVRDTLDIMAIIDDKKIIYEGTLEGVYKVENSFIKTFFRGI